MIGLGLRTVPEYTEAEAFNAVHTLFHAMKKEGWTLDQVNYRIVFRAFLEIPKHTIRRDKIEKLVLEMADAEMYPDAVLSTNIVKSFIERNQVDDAKAIIAFLINLHIGHYAFLAEFQFDPISNPQALADKFLAFVIDHYAALGNLHFVVHLINYLSSRSCTFSPLCVLCH